MKKRIFSAFLALAMAVTLIPTMPVSADEAPYLYYSERIRNATELRISEPYAQLEDSINVDMSNHDYLYEVMLKNDFVMTWNWSDADRIWQEVLDNSSPVELWYYDSILYYDSESGEFYGVFRSFQIGENADGITVFYNSENKWAVVLEKNTDAFRVMSAWLTGEPVEGEPEPEPEPEPDPEDDEEDDENPKSGVVLGFAAVVIAGGIMAVTRRKR